MTKIVIVADQPSLTNVSPDVAFVGSKSFNTVVDWIKYLEPDYYVCLNSDTVGQLSDVKALYKAGFKVIALGKKAAERLNEIDVVYIELPHPSPKNRLLNDKKYIKRELQVVYEYIHDTKEAVLQDLKESTGGYMSVDREAAWNNNLDTIKKIAKSFGNAISR